MVVYWFILYGYYHVNKNSCKYMAPIFMEFVSENYASIKTQVSTMEKTPHTYDS